MVPKPIFTFLMLLVVVLSSCENKDAEENSDKQNSVEASSKDVSATENNVSIDTHSSSDKTENELESTRNQELATKPVNSGYSAEFVPANMTVQEKKKRFKILILPAVETVYLELDTQFKQISVAVKSEQKSEQQTKQIQTLMDDYKVSTDQALLIAIKPHPKSIALAQAAMESAWGTSRFFTEAKNIFGVWSFNKDEPRIAASKKRGNKTIWLKKYETITDSIRDYYKVLAKGRAFTGFRKQKMLTNDPLIMVRHLDKYSEKGAEYGKELSSMIKFNKFDQYD